LEIGAELDEIWNGIKARAEKKNYGFQKASHYWNLCLGSD